jgi:hypothetical protein
MSRIDRATSAIDDSTAWAWIGVAVLCGCAMLAAVLALFLVPVYAGTVVVPVAVAAALATNIVLPRLARALIPTTGAAMLPFASWLIVVIAVGTFPRPEGDVVLPGGGGALQWVSYGVLLGGALAGTVTVVLSSGTGRLAAPPPTPPAAPRRPRTGPRPG